MERWVDLYDANRKLVESDLTISLITPTSPDSVTVWNGVSSVAYDLQNTHMTVWCGYANPYEEKAVHRFPGTQGIL